MPNSGALVRTLLDLRKPAISVGFFDNPPPGLQRWSGGAVPAGCVFWQKAWDGEAFYTQATDHYNCAVGAYTHGLPLPAERVHELDESVGFMVQNSYLAVKPAQAMLRYGAALKAGAELQETITANQRMSAYYRGKLTIAQPG